MKKFIKVFAMTSSEWDYVNCVLVELNENFLSLAKKYIELIKSLNKSDERIYSINIFEHSLTFSDLFFSDNNDEIDENLCEIIEVEDLDTEYNHPQQRIVGHSVEFGVYGVLVKGFGKHTDEEFWGVIPNEFILSISLPKEIKTLFETDYVIYDKANDQPLADSYGRILLFGDRKEADVDCCGNEMVISCTELPQHWQDEILKQINKD